MQSEQNIDSKNILSFHTKRKTLSVNIIMWFRMREIAS